MDRSRDPTQHSLITLPNNEEVKDRWDKAEVTLIFGLVLRTKYIRNRLHAVAGDSESLNPAAPLITDEWPKPAIALKTHAVAFECN